MTEPAVAWPFGLAGLPPGLWQPAKVFALPVTILLGTDDTDPNHHSLPHQPEAMAQGPYRLARGRAFYARARALAAADKVAFAWSRSEEHTSELQSLMRNSYAVFCLKNKNTHKSHN